MHVIQEEIILETPQKESNFITGGAERHELDLSYNLFLENSINTHLESRHLLNIEGAEH